MDAWFQFLELSDKLTAEFILKNGTPHFFNIVSSEISTQSNNFRSVSEEEANGLSDLLSSAVSTENDFLVTKTLFKKQKTELESNIFSQMDNLFLQKKTSLGTPNSICETKNIIALIQAFSNITDSDACVNILPVDSKRKLSLI